jgi:ribosomal protein S18 acetylase RimI-like enzyme
VGPLERYRLKADAWLGEMLGRPAWSVVEAASGPSLAELAASRAHFATAKMPATDVAAVEAFEGLGFHAVDMALTFDVERADIAAQGARVRWAQPGDRAAVEAIAGSAFRFSRFHLDPKLPKALADKIKAAWAGNWFAGKRGDGMVVAEQADGAVAGFLQLCWAPENRLMIDLIAVQPDSIRKGYARAMIGFAGLKGTGDGRLPRGMIVGTQAANIASIRLYESLGFRLRDAKYVLHHHGGGR